MINLKRHDNNYTVKLMIEYKETHACSLTLVKTDDLDKKGTPKTSNKMQLES